MKRSLLSFFLCLICVAGATADPPSVEFDWAFMRRSGERGLETVPSGERVAIAEGELFKIYVRPIGPTYVYVFLNDAAGELSLLFPARFDDFAGSRYQGGSFFVPEGDDWFSLDGASGTETFYLVASTARLAELESAYAAFESCAARRSAPTALAASRQAVLDELSRLRKRHSAIAAAAEKPIAIAGGTRDLSGDVKRSATRVAGGAYYGKTFRLVH